MGEERYFFRIGVDGDEKGPVSLERLGLMRASEKRFLFIRAEGDDEWTPYSRSAGQRREDPGPSREWLSDVTRVALGRITFGILMIVLGGGLSFVSPWIFVGLIVVGLVAVGRGVYRWIDGRP